MSEEQVKILRVESTKINEERAIFSFYFSFFI